jgi:hypothetical protein
LRASGRLDIQARSRYQVRLPRPVHAFCELRETSLDLLREPIAASATRTLYGSNEGIRTVEDARRGFNRPGASSVNLDLRALLCQLYLSDCHISEVGRVNDPINRIQRYSAQVLELGLDSRTISQI